MKINGFSIFLRIFDVQYEIYVSMQNIFRLAYVRDLEALIMSAPKNINMVSWIYSESQIRTNVTKKWRIENKSEFLL